MLCLMQLDGAEPVTYLIEDNADDLAVRCDRALVDAEKIAEAILARAPWPAGSHALGAGWWLLVDP
jgi:hypothetical protein